jgi:hypothetical protein
MSANYAPIKVRRRRRWATSTHGQESDSQWGQEMSGLAEERRLADEWLPDIQQVIVSTAGVLAVGILYIILPDTVRIGPAWLLLTVELVLATHAVA